MLEGDSLTLFFHLHKLILEVDLGDIVRVLDRLTGFLKVTLE